MLLALAAILVAAPVSGGFDLPLFTLDQPVADSTPVLFARARAQARAGNGAEAMRTYLAGARVATSDEDWNLYRRDLAWIATPSELRAFASVGPGGRVAWLREYWAARDQRDGLGEGGRLREHVRRVDVAVADYAIHPRRGKVPVSRAANGGSTAFDVTVGSGSFLRDYVPAQGQIDDRGVIFIRHGEPTVRVPSTVGIESWVYEREGGDNLVVHFSENVFDGSSGNTTLIAAPPISALANLCGVDSASCVVAERFGGGAMERRERLRQRALAAIRVLTTTES